MIKIAILTAAAAALVPASVSAELAATDSRSVEVKHADLNLASAAGKETLHRRISLAIRQVCGSYQLDLIGNRQVSRCRDEALDGAVAQVMAIGAGPRRGTVTVTAMR